MPYRRLPKTDATRLKALKDVINKTQFLEYHNQFVPFALINKARNILSTYEKHLTEYQTCVQIEGNANKQFQHLMRNAQSYVSHFTQVLNLAVIRGDIKREHKEFYKLDPSTNTVPELSNSNAVLYWGKNIIDGETERLSKGGFAIYNPTIAKVKVHYNIFREYHTIQQQHKQTTERSREALNKQRNMVDELLLEIWNLIEDHFKDYKPYERLIKCEEYGMIYYYRANEPVLTPESDLD